MASALLGPFLLAGNGGCCFGIEPQRASIGINLCEAWDYNQLF